MTRRFARVPLLVTIAGLAGAAIAGGSVPDTNGRAAATLREQQGGRDCALEFRAVITNGVATTRFQSIPASPTRSNYFAGGGVDAFCTNSDQRLLSDSAEQYGDRRLLYLIGNVHYSENRVELTADLITYYMAEERLVAEGNVVGRTSTGTRFRGPRAVYLRAKPGLRDRSRLDAGGRPDTWISGADAGTDGVEQDSTHVLADSIISDNDSLIYARGNVEILRPDLSATADSAMLDQGNEIAALRRSPRVVGRGERKFTLEGTEIDIFSRNRQAERVRSAGSAKATSDEVLLAADTIDLRITEQQLSRAIAWGTGGARATQDARDITADSIDVNMPGQVLHSMHAVRRARAESLADSTTIRSNEHDWFAGDTIVATFDTLAPGDSGAAGIRRLEALGSAQSWQQAARDGATVPDSMPAINYMAGQSIAVEFGSDRTLSLVRVVGKVSGVLMQPTTDTLKQALPAAVKRPPVPPGSNR
ncbi:MAG: hypothetical protein O2973_06540 [Gemmatimonadetes bacterium]|nr:hypothetical protein [Gemmatimonadota bacterium]